jgi:hypothetical protein
MAQRCLFAIQHLRYTRTTRRQQPAMLQHTMLHYQFDPKLQLAKVCAYSLPCHLLINRNANTHTRALPLLSRLWYRLAADLVSIGAHQYQHGEANIHRPLGSAPWIHAGQSSTDRWRNVSQAVKDAVAQCNALRFVACAAIRAQQQMLIDRCLPVRCMQRQAKEAQSKATWSQCGS